MLHAATCSHVCVITGVVYNLSTLLWWLSCLRAIDLFEISPMQSSLAAVNSSDLTIKFAFHLFEPAVCWYQRRGFHDMQELDLDMLLMSIHDYFMGLGVDEIRRRGADDDKPLRMVKTILHELCKLKVSQHLQASPPDFVLLLTGPSRPVNMQLVDSSGTCAVLSSDNPYLLPEAP